MALEAQFKRSTILIILFFYFRPCQHVLERTSCLVKRESIEVRPYFLTISLRLSINEMCNEISAFEFYG